MTATLRFFVSSVQKELVKWENTTEEKVLQPARDEIWQSWRYTCAEQGGSISRTEQP